ncbi:MAG: radical SAM protein [Zetaproteobacteria bacterium]|nr:radical SAM protein [Zetaproteobacteria bacterium]
MNDFTLTLQQGKVVYCSYSSPQELTLHHIQHTKVLYFSGIFAEAIASLQTTQVNIPHLQQIERAHPSLEGLSHAKLAPLQASELLLGESLGMVFIELTSQCNERCLHCYAESSPERQEFLSFDEIYLSLQQIRELGRPFIQFTGGDPLIHRDLIRLVQAAHQLDFQGIEIYTNGLLLTDKLLAQLQPYQPQLSFSVYADCAEIHDAITRVQGSWKRTLAAMQRAIDQGFEVRVGVVIMQENAEHIAELPHFLETKFGLSPAHIRFDPVNTVGRGSTTFLPEHINIQSSHAIAQGESRRGKLCIASNGDVYPCIFSRKLRLGNIREQSLPQIYMNLRYRDASQITEARWQTCQEQLSCSDCQMIACLLAPPIHQETNHEPSLTRLPNPSRYLGL